MELKVLLPFFQWCDTTMLGQWMRGGTWEFPIVESIHILALVLLLGCIVVVDLQQGAVSRTDHLMQKLVQPVCLHAALQGERIRALQFFHARQLLAHMRGQTLEEFQKTRNAPGALYSVAGEETKPLARDATSVMWRTLQRAAAGFSPT